MIEMTPEQNRPSLFFGFPKTYYNRFWYLRAPEVIGSDEGFVSRFDPRGAAWRQVEDRWEYRIDLPPMAKGEEDPIRPWLRPFGHVVIIGEFAVRGDTVEFSLTFRNVGDTPWKRAYAWLCLRHPKKMPEFDSLDNVYVVGPSGPTSLTALPGGADLHQRCIWLVENKDSNHGFVDGHSLYSWPRSPSPVKQGIMVTHHPTLNNVVALEVNQPLFLARNIANPCTDIAMDLGDVSPGEECQRSGRVVMALGRPEDLFGGVEPARR